MCASCRSSTIRTCFSKCPASLSPKICNRANHLPSCHSVPSLPITNLFSASPSQLDCWKSSEICQDLMQELLLLESGLGDRVECYDGHTARLFTRNISGFFFFLTQFHEGFFFFLFCFFFCEICTAISGTEANVMGITLHFFWMLMDLLSYLTQKTPTNPKHETI